MNPFGKVNHPGVRNAHQKEPTVKHQYATTRLLVIALACLSGAPLVPLGQAASGSLVGSVAGPIANGTVVDLTAEGPADWAAWGRTSATSFDHKATGGGQISDITPIDPFFLLIQNMPTGISISWSDGTPEPVVTGNINNVSIETVGNGFRFTVPAGLKSQRLKVYVGVWNGDGQLTAQLSDGSAVAYTNATPSDTTGPQFEKMYVYTLEYQASSAGQVLTVEYIATRVAGGGGHVSISAATLSRLSAFDDTTTQIALPLDAPPVIDGVIDTAEWGRASTWQVTVDTNLTDGIRGGNFADAAGRPADNSDLSFQIYAGYDATNLYVAVRVTDSAVLTDNATANSYSDVTWLDDSVEVFIDGDNGDFEGRNTDQYVEGGTNSTKSGQFVITPNNSHNDWGQQSGTTPGFGEDKVWFARSTTNATGYDAEFRFPLKSIGDRKPGDIIGFSVGVNEDDGAGRESQVLWRGVPHTEPSWGNLVIGGRAYSAPKTNAPTIDGVIGANEYADATETRVSNFSSIYDLGVGDDIWEATDHGYSAWVVHDADAVYVAINVTDDMVVNDTATAGSEDGTTWEDDSVEIFFDADHSHDTGRGAGQFEGQYVFTANGARRDNEANNPTFGASADWFAATSATAGGYQVEFKIKKSALFNPQDGATLGFSIAVNDDDGSGRKAQLNWSGRAHSEFTYGHLTLSGGPPPPRIESIRQSGTNLEISFQSPNPAGTHVIRQTANLTPAVVWAPTPGVTFSGAPNNPLTATFPKPAGSAMFYQVGQQP